MLCLVIKKSTLLSVNFVSPSKEISKVMKSSYLRGLNMASFFCASKIIIFITFTLYVLLGNTISASRVFVTVSLYSSVRLTVTLFFPSAIEKLFECRVSVRRIQVSLTSFPFILKRGSPPDVAVSFIRQGKNEGSQMFSLLFH